ncbi:hypothetical protein H5410_012414 [Solanum commersonii]|uniref:Uncharacterized protein n=1 Tax=Solanum commersonii TaxID=4109 RepID=A0A9J6AS36_SOLCO|nr:hypothetical protein H5410_012414 [Solanum commersonii]
MYLNGRFNYQDLVSMTDPYFLFECKHVDEILSLMLESRFGIPSTMTKADLILDLNFYNTLYDRLQQLEREEFSGWCSTNA